MTLARAGERRSVLFAIGALGFSCVITQLALMRESLGAFTGNEMVLGVVLGLWLLLMGLGTGLGRVADRLRNPLLTLGLALWLVAILPLLQVFCLRALRNVIFTRGAEVGVSDTLIGTFVLLLPYCLVAGCALTLACALLARGEGPAGIGSVYVADSLGSVAGGVLFSFLLVRCFDHLALLVLPALLNLLAAAVVLGRSGRRRLAGLTLTLAAVLAAAAVCGNLDALSTAWQYPRQHVVARANSPYGRIIVTESDGQFDFIENGVPLASTRDDQHVEETVHYAMAQRPDARKVLLVSGGITGTAREILKYPLAHVDYVELDPLVLELGRKYVPDNLSDDRIRVINTDGRQFIQQADKLYDIIIVDVPDPSTAQINRFYTFEFFAAARHALARDGVLSFSLGHYENYVNPELARILSSARRSLQPTFPNVRMIPGERVFLLASEGPLFEDIADRIERHQIKTKLVNRHYLDGMLTADRLADMARATKERAAINADFRPVLYYYHLRRWMSQFNVSFGALQILPLLLFGAYLVRLRGPALVLFASGFAGSALEIVLLLAFQVLCGSVYHQVGVVVTVFMAGLALGALVTNRDQQRQEPLKAARDGAIACCDNPAHAARPPRQPSGTHTARRLTQLALAIAGCAVLIPVLLPLLNRLGGTAASVFLIKTVIALLTLLLGLLVGMQFPLASRIGFDGIPGRGTGVARLYTADFVGASLGALLASALLIPLLGMSGVCLVAAALNLVGAVALLRQSAADRAA